MAKLIFSRDTDADFKKIYSDLALKAGTVTALKYRDRFRPLIRQLAFAPESGAPRPKLGARMRICVVRPYVLIYRYIAETDTVEVLRVVHGKQNITRALLQNIRF